MWGVSEKVKRWLFEVRLSEHAILTTSPPFSTHSCVQSYEHVSHWVTNLDRNAFAKGEGMWVCHARWDPFFVKETLIFRVTCPTFWVEKFNGSRHTLGPVLLNHLDFSFHLAVGRFHQTNKHQRWQRHPQKRDCSLAISFWLLTHLLEPRALLYTRVAYTYAP